MEERSDAVIPHPAGDAEPGDLENAPDDEVEGHSMAISANFAIDIGGMAAPPVRPVVGSDGGPTPGSDTPTNPNPQVR